MKTLSKYLLVLFLYISILLSGCYHKNENAQGTNIASNIKNAEGNNATPAKRNIAQVERQHLQYLSPPGFITYGGAEESFNKETKESLLRYGISTSGEIKHIYQTKLSNTASTITIALIQPVHKAAIKGDDVGWYVLLFLSNNGIIVKNYGLSFSSVSYGKWYNDLKNRSNIPGDWVGCGFVGDFNGDDIYELLVFSALGMGFFMEVYEYDSESDSFRQTFYEELNILSTELVQYGEAKGTKGFFLNNSTTNDWTKKAFYGWDPGQRKYVFMASYLAGKEME
jgi:hypothetical protein